MNFKLFYDKKKPKERKNLIIILRDYYENYNFKSITDAVVNDLHKIWQEIAKPEEFKHSSLDVFFDINFERMPHYQFQKTEFMAEAENQYKKYIQPNHESYFFKDISTKPVVPLDSLHLYMKSVWSTIRNCKDIDIPSQRFLISEYRCSQIKNEILKEYAIPEIQSINSKMTGIYVDLASRSDKVFQESMNQYNEKTDYYVEEIVERHRSELKSLIIEDLNKFLRKQLKFIEKYITKAIAQSFKKLDTVLQSHRTTFMANWSKQ